MWRRSLAASATPTTATEATVALSVRLSHSRTYLMVQKVTYRTQIFYDCQILTNIRRFRINRLLKIVPYLKRITVLVLCFEVW